MCDPGIKEQLIKKLQELQIFEDNIPAICIVHDVRDFSVVYMSRKGLDTLGVSLSEIRMPNREYHERYFNPNDVQNYLPKVQDLLQRNTDEMVTLFQQVRRHTSDPWTWYLSSMKIFARDENGNPLLNLTFAVPIEPNTHVSAKVERLIEENNFYRDNLHIFKALTKREKEMLRLIASGYNSVKISKELNIADATVLTHRKNLKRKIKVKTGYDILRFALAFDLI
jgi:DNA-binding CsgD family transcriptional regulator